MTSPCHVVIVEPFACGSHRQLDQYLQGLLSEESIKVTTCELPGSKWHWRARAGSLWAVSAIPRIGPQEAASTVLFASSMLNLCEVLALRPDLSAVRKILYFHENQLVYPVRKVVPATASGAPPSTSEAAPLAVTTLVGETAPSLSEETGSAAAPSAEVPPLKRARAEVAASASPSSGSGGDTSNGNRMDFHFGWLQVLSCLTADVIAFNSGFNRSSFIESIPGLIKMIPDKAQRPNADELQATIKGKSRVVYFPVAGPPRGLNLIAGVEDSSSAGTLPLVASAGAGASGAATAPLSIVWPHRWEYDKQPEVFFSALHDLHKHSIDFRAIVLGESFAEVPMEFAHAKAWLEASGKLAHWGYAPSRDEYWRLLGSADVVVSTACHEFFGVSTVEAVMAGCWPLCPGGLAYPELLSPTPQELLDALSSSDAAASSGAPLKLHRQAALPHTRVDDDRGGCPHLYKSYADLKKKLTALAKDPNKVRQWKQQWLARFNKSKSTQAEATGALPDPTSSATSSSPAPKGAAAAPPSFSSFRFDRFDAVALKRTYLDLLTGGLLLPAGDASSKA